MLPISRILVPTDFSERSLGILPYARALAENHNAKVILLHTVDPFYTVPPTGFSGPVVIPVSSSVIKEREQRMEQFGVSELQGLAVRRLVQEGDAVGQIIAFARDERVSLIAMPTHGYGALRRFLIGSITSKVLHDAACPVLTGVHSDKPITRSVGLTNVLCAIDLGPQSEEVLAWTGQFAADFKAKVGIVHCIGPLSSGLRSSVSPQLLLELEAAARTQIEKLQSATNTLDAAVHLRVGEPAHELSSLAESANADLLVIGRGPKDREGGRLPANAYAIIRQSPCAVVSV
jgi:nucleotide-binding universal stress UspA family protein